jgi:hypothetical protein
MNQLERFPSLQAFGEQLDERAERDAHRHARRLLAPVARLAVVVVVVVLVAGGAYAVPVTRAAVDDVYSAFSDWFSGGGEAAPGRAVAVGEDVPAWVTAEDGQKRVLAEADGQKLVAIRRGDKLTFALADFGTTDTIEGVTQSLAGRRIVIVGPGRFIANGRHDRRPLFGLVSASVKRVQFNYADGGPSVSADDLDGAFGITIETSRRPRSLTAYDEAGSRVARLDFVADPRDLVPGQTLGDFRYCPADGCTPWSDRPTHKTGK